MPSGRVDFSGSSGRFAEVAVIRTIQRMGEIILDLPIDSTDHNCFFPSTFSLSSIKTLSDATLKHWGLLTSPFRVDSPTIETRSTDGASDFPDFYFRSPPHARLLSWLESELTARRCGSGLDRAEPPVLLLRSQIGAGVAMALRQLSHTRGIGRVALETRVSQWSYESVESLRDDLMPRVANDQSVFLWCVHASRPSQAQTVSGWLRRNMPSDCPSTVLIRIEDHPGTRRTLQTLPTFTLTRTDPNDMIGCVESALRHAGATAPIFTGPAIRRLVEGADGSFVDLAEQTHRLLSWSHAHRFDVIGEQVIGQYHAYHHKPIDIRSRRAA